MGEIIHEERVHWAGARFAGALFWSVVMLAGGITLGVLTSGWWLAVLGGALAAVGLAFAFMALNFRVLRVRVAEDVLEVRLGFFRKQIPVGDIQVMGLRSWRHEGRVAPAWGIQPVVEGPDRYTAWGGTGDCLAVVTAGRKDRPSERLLIGSTNPQHLMGAIAQAQKSLPVPEPSPLQVVN